MPASPSVSVNGHDPWDGTPDPVSKAASVPFTELGRTGLAQWGGRVQDDILKILQGEQAIRVYREMAENDPVVGATLFGIEMLLRKLEWKIIPFHEPGSNDPPTEKAIAYADFCRSVIHDMSATWADTVSAILSMLPFGWSYLEIVWKKRNGGDPTDGGKYSAHDDGKVGWRKLALRSQDTLERWEFDDHDGVKGMHQRLPLAIYGDNTRFNPQTAAYIPIQKALLFRTTTARANPEGRSVLRNAYRPWYFKRRIEEIEAIGIERDLAGLPIAYVPAQMLAENASLDEKNAVEAIKKLVRNIRRDEQEGLVFPRAYDPETRQPLYEIELLSTGGRRQFDTDAVIARYNQQIAMTTLADFVMLGHEAVGSKALGGSKIDLFQEALAAWAQSIADVFTNIGFPRLLKANGMETKLAPVMEPGRVERRDLATLGAFLQQVAQAGFQLASDPTLESWVREVGGMPPKDKDAVEMDQKRKELEEAQLKQELEQAKSPTGALGPAVDALSQMGAAPRPAAQRFATPPRIGPTGANPANPSIPGRPGPQPAPPQPSGRRAGPTTQPPRARPPRALPPATKSRISIGEPE